MIGACIVPVAHDAKLPTWRNEIVGRLQKPWRQIHFCDLSHDQRVVVSQEIAKLPIEAALTLSHKVTIPGTKWAEVFRKKGYLYNYLVRWLLERITTHVATSYPKEKNRLRLVFSKRGGTDYASMRDYMILMRDGRERIKPIRTIRWDVLDVNDLAVEDHANFAGLQLADCITSAFYAAVEPNRFGNFEPRYADTLRGVVMRRPNNNALNHGVCPLPSWYGCQPEDHHKEFFLSFSKK